MDDMCMTCFKNIQQIYVET